MSNSLRRIVAAGTCAVLLGSCSKLRGKSDSTNVAQTGGIATASADTTPKTPPPPIALPVPAEPARDGDLLLSIITSGQVRSENEAHLKSEVTGTVQKVYIRPGQSVTRGQKLVEFDMRPFDLTMRQKQSDVDKATLDYRDLSMSDSLAGRKTTDEIGRASCRERV